MGLLIPIYEGNARNDGINMTGIMSSNSQIQIIILILKTTPYFGRIKHW